MTSKPLFTIIMLTYNRPHLLKEAVAHLLSQTYTNLEIIIINNAATPETQEYLAWLEGQDSRVRLVHFKTNQYDPNDPLKFYGICCNAAFNIAKGEYIFHQEDDDFISPDYVERMVALFRDNPQCTTAAGLPVNVDVNGEVMPMTRVSNFRPRYMEGHLMALDTLRTPRGVMFSAPGTVFTVKRDVLAKTGGFHADMDACQLYGLVPFGVTGFDEKAILYWRRHEQQLNRSSMLEGHMMRYHYSLLKEWDLLKKLQDSFGKPTAVLLVRSFIRQKREMSAENFMHCLYAFSWRGAWRLFSQVWYSWDFWKNVPHAAWIKKWVLKATLKKTFGKKPKVNTTGAAACPESLSQAR